MPRGGPSEMTIDTLGANKLVLTSMWICCRAESRDIDSIHLVLCKPYIYVRSRINMYLSCTLYSPGH